ncbi:MAG: hypothetical protein DRG69_01535 [Deltaproteobacteria bacterium]|nr:MAG: hypothetical protein DRG69_01535 [Deltaproteobacteria bacterium]
MLAEKDILATIWGRNYLFDVFEGVVQQDVLRFMEGNGIQVEMQNKEILQEAWKRFLEDKLEDISIGEFISWAEEKGFLWKALKEK